MRLETVYTTRKWCSLQFVKNDALLALPRWFSEKDAGTKKGLPSSYWKTLKCQKKISLEEKDKGSECLSETLITKGIDHSSFFPFSSFLSF